LAQDGTALQEILIHILDFIRRRGPQINTKRCGFNHLDLDGLMHHRLSL